MYLYSLTSPSTWFQMDVAWLFIHSELIPGLAHPGSVFVHCNEAVFSLQVRESRDAEVAKRCLVAIEQCARTRDGNLLELAVDAARARWVRLHEVQMQRTFENDCISTKKQTHLQKVYSNPEPELILGYHLFMWRISESVAFSYIFFFRLFFIYQCIY